MDTLSMFSFSDLLINLFYLLALIALGRIWLYAKQAVELLREQNGILREQLESMTAEYEVVEVPAPVPVPMDNRVREMRAVGVRIPGK